MNDFVPLKSFKRVYEAQIAAGLLEEQDIVSYMKVEDFTDRVPEIAAGKVSLFVLKSDFIKAQEIIAILND